MGSSQRCKGNINNVHYDQHSRGFASKVICKFLCYSSKTLYWKRMSSRGMRNGKKTSIHLCPTHYVLIVLMEANGFELSHNCPLYEPIKENHPHSKDKPVHEFNSLADFQWCLFKCLTWKQSVVGTRISHLPKRSFYMFVPLLLF